ncbi:MAG: hypothetical protein ACTS5I_01470 [Rhodanobacter sp.]
MIDEQVVNGSRFVVNGPPAHIEELLLNMRHLYRGRRAINAAVAEASLLLSGSFAQSCAASSAGNIHPDSAAGARHVEVREADLRVVCGVRVDACANNGIDLRGGVNDADCLPDAYLTSLTDKRGICSPFSETPDSMGTSFSAMCVMPRTIGVSNGVCF